MHLLADINTVKQAFVSIAGHLRKGACLAMELILPSSGSYQYPKRTFYPRVPNYSDKKVWKEGQSRYDAAVKRHYIDQIVYVQDGNGTESFNYSVTLQYFERSEILDALSCAGFTVAGEYRNRNKDRWMPEDTKWSVEAIKQ